jgi:hypothetical protein
MENFSTPTLRMVALVRHPSMIISAICFALGMFLLTAGGSEGDLQEAFQVLMTPRGLAYALIGAGTVAYLYAAIRVIKIRSFSEIDERAKRESLDVTTVREMTNEIRELSQAEKIDYAKIEEIIKQQISHKEQPATSSDFRGHSFSLSRVLEEKARLSDEKASTLLDKGTFYVWVGIIFYLASIVVWQVVIVQSTFRPEFIYGMVSCTFLFLFIEFLSAWFLKQYRHFVDTSTYLLKVKAIFDRYHLLFLAIAGEKKDLSDDEAKSKLLSKALMDEFQWPSDSHLNKADVAFAKEALASLSSLIKASRAEKKGTDDD